MLGGCRLLRQLAAKGRTQRSYDCQITFRMGHTLRRCAHHLGIQNPDYHRFVYYGSRIHRLVHQSKGGHSFDGDTQGSNRAWGADHQLTPKNPLHGFRRQQRRFGIGALTKKAATDETHKSVVSSLPGTRRKAGNYSAGHTD